MHFQFLIEDLSSEGLIDELMLKIEKENTQVTHDCKSFRGIGGFTKRNTVKETRTGKLLNDLATYLRGFNKSLRNCPAVVFVVLDNDDNDPRVFQAQLEKVANDNCISLDHVFCIAVEEMEAWLLGDEMALLKAYPKSKQQILRLYVQDSICGTWETLAEVVYPGGLSQLRKDCPSYREIGKKKAEWAKTICVYMDMNLNKSPSFNYFIMELRQRISPVA